MPGWFALEEDRSLAFFAEIWVPQWTSVWKLKEGETANDFYAFLTTEPNPAVAPIQPKAIPAILTEPEELAAWMTAPSMWRRSWSGRCRTMTTLIGHPGK